MFICFGLCVLYYLFHLHVHVHVYAHVDIHLHVLVCILSIRFTYVTGLFILSSLWGYIMFYNAFGFKLLFVSLYSSHDYCFTLSMLLICNLRIISHISLFSIIHGIIGIFLCFCVCVNSELCQSYMLLFITIVIHRIYI